MRKSMSPGRYHEIVPRSYEANLKFRRSILSQCRGDRSAQRAMVDACRRDFLLFVNCWTFQFNPILKGHHATGPFITWAFQEKMLMMRPPEGRGILWCYENDRTSVTEKSRDMGASWLYLIFQVWLCVFHDDVQCLNISRSLEAVDDASRDSLFSKIRYILKHLPDWMKGEVDDQKCCVRFSRTGSEISGEASTGRAGTGGRASVIFVDEYSKIREDVKVRQTTAGTADCRFFNGTHEGVSAEFFNLTEESKKFGEIVLIQMHWTRHPRKNRQMYSWDVEEGKPRWWKYKPEVDEIVEMTGPVVPFPEDYPFDRSGQPSGGPHPGIRSVWYDQKAKDIGPARLVAMELDINPTGSSSQFYEAMTIRRLLTQVREPLWTGEITYDQTVCKPISLDPLPDGHLELWIEPGLNSAGKICHVTPSVYVLGCDLGSGAGVTPSCISIFDCERGMKVGSYMHLWKDAKDMAWIAVSLARLFKDQNGESALLGWEVPGPGLTFGNEVVKEINYRNVYWKRDEFSDDEKESQTPGWNASPKSKLSLHTEYHSALRSGLFVNPHRQALNQTLAFVHLNGSVEHPKAKKNDDEAAKGLNHGDLVVADGIALMLARKKDVPRVDDEKPTLLPIPNSIAGRREYNRLRERAAQSIWQRA